MFSDEIRKLLVQVISSWQVLVVTVVLVIYISLVNYVVKVRYRRPQKTAIRKPKSKSKTTETQVTTDSDDLGMEE